MASKISASSKSAIGSPENIGALMNIPTLKPFEKDSVAVKSQSSSCCLSELKLKICAFFSWLLNCICCRSSEKKSENEIPALPTKEVEDEVSVPSQCSQTLPLEPLVESEPEIDVPEVLPSEKEAFGKAENYLLTRNEDLELVKYKELDKTTQLCVLFILACDENFEIIDQYYRAYGNKKTVTTAAPLNFYDIKSGDLDIVALPLHIQDYFAEDLELFEELATYKAAKDSGRLFEELANRARHSYGIADRFVRSLQARPTEKSDVDHFDAKSDAVKLLIVAFYSTEKGVEEGRILIFYPRIQTIFNDPTNYPSILNCQRLQTRLLVRAKELLFPEQPQKD
jgi:hypothetical protein